MGSHVGKIHVEDVLTENLHLEAAVTYADDPYEAALAHRYTSGGCGAGTSCTARYQYDAEVGPWEDGYLYGV